MGVTRWLDLIHPDDWEAATLRIQRYGADLLSPAARYGASPRATAGPVSVPK